MKEELLLSKISNDFLEVSDMRTITEIREADLRAEM